jgi:hypothetical protein
MGTPLKIVLDGQPVFLCCKGCEKQARDHASETLKTVRERKASSPPPVAKAAPAVAPILDEAEAEIQTALAKLSPADRAMAEAQRFCAVRPKNRLGSMDVPQKIMIDGKVVFLCCDGCEQAARRNATATLSTVEKMKTANAKK